MTNNLKPYDIEKLERIRLGFEEINTLVIVQYNISIEVHKHKIVKLFAAINLLLTREL